MSNFFDIFFVVNLGESTFSDLKSFLSKNGITLNQVQDVFISMYDHLGLMQPQDNLKKVCTPEKLSLEIFGIGMFDIKQNKIAKYFITTQRFLIASLSLFQNPNSLMIKAGVQHDLVDHEIFPMEEISFFSQICTWFLIHILFRCILFLKKITVKLVII